MRRKLQSRKFWLSFAAMLASFASSIAGLNSGNEVMVSIGIMCGMFSAGIYAFCEAWTDVRSIEKEDEK